MLTTSWWLCRKTFPDYKQLETFVDKIVDLRANIYYHDIDALQSMFDQFQNLNKLYITENLNQSGKLAIPQVQHFIYNGWRFKCFYSLYRFSEQCPDLEVVELKKKLIGIHKIEKTLKFRNLKKFTFKFDGIEELQNLEYIFKDTNTELNAIKWQLAQINTKNEFDWLIKKPNE